MFPSLGSHDVVRHEDATTKLLYQGALAPHTELFNTAFNRFRSECEEFADSHDYHYCFVPALQSASVLPHGDLARMLSTRPNTGLHPGRV